ncbi:MAG TPA: hypothetical protein VFI61_03240 [Patescibacteria group bacterium]|nr:hypothetical protein [Patescibacteria group bacterium]
MQKTKIPNFISVLVLTLLTAVMWVSFNVYRAIATKPAPVVPPEISEPLTPSLDTATLNQINTKIFLDDSQIPSSNFVVATPIPTIIPIPTATAVASPSAIPVSSPASESGTTQ